MLASGGGIPHSEMLGMGQQRRSVIRNQHRPEFNQPVQIGIKPARLQRRCSAANGRCGFRHSIPRWFESNIVQSSIPYHNASRCKPLQGRGFFVCGLNHLRGVSGPWKAVLQMSTRPNGIPATSTILELLSRSASHRHDRHDGDAKGPRDTNLRTEGRLCDRTEGRQHTLTLMA